MTTRDFTTDDSMAFLLLLKEAGALPDWLEKVAEPADVEKLPDVAFADPHRRLMPIHDKSAAYLSAVSSCVYGYPSDGIWENRLKAACQSYGITALVKQAHDVLAPEPEPQKEASSTVKKAFALEIEVTPGSPLRSFYPMSSPEKLEDSAMKMASDMFAQKLPESWFAEAADAMLKQAAEFGMPETRLPQSIRRLAEDRLPSPEYLTEQIERRQKQAALSGEAVEIYKESASAVLEGEASALDAAHVWELADRKFGISYGGSMASPVSAFRSGMTRSRFEKLAGTVVPIAGIPVPFNRLTTLSDRLVASSLPAKIASAVLHAKRQEDGLKAAGFLTPLEEPEQLQVLEFLTATCDA